MIEREVKMAAPAVFCLPQFGDLDASIAREVADRAALSTVYYDTSDVRLARWGCSLRYRRGQGWTLKLPQESDGRLLVRAEHEFAGSAQYPPEAALDLLTAYLRGAQLAAVARLRTVRNRVVLADAGGGRLATITDDLVSVLNGRKIGLRFREVEVELGDDVSDSLIECLLARLREAGAGEIDPTPKVVRALGARASQPSEVDIIAVDGDANAADIVRNALASSVIQLIRHDAGIRLGRDPDCVHRARVALRRMRSHLKTFAPFFEERWARELRDAAAGLASQLGTVRDADVLIQRLRSDAAALGLAAPARRTLVRQFQKRRATALSCLHETMRRQSYVALLKRFVDAARDPKLAPTTPAQPAAVTLLPLVAADWEKLRKAVDALSPAEVDDDALHKIRIRAKRCRYGAEALTPVAGKEAKSFVRKTAALQEILGTHHDSTVERQALEEFRTRAKIAFDAGQLAAAAALAGSHSRQRWRDAWRSLSRKRHSKWLAP
ncbi:MAG: CYTH and CHAD domain-containing protein [Candidatus Eremiobacteraeota bacterium]|nr:CYTH and CHAD domain-containing protein [Candidatus Eremiobacteraeota bacterium]MBC5827959.1 CYTH and CHAD domain-containing protein [Candidatus Eremiobacteraeota bacterium]